MKLPDTTRILIHDTADKLEEVYNEHQKEVYSYNADQFNAYIRQMADIIKDFRSKANSFDLEFADMDRHTVTNFEVYQRYGNDNKKTFGRFSIKGYICGIENTQNGFIIATVRYFNKNNPLSIKNLLQNGSLLSAPTCLFFK